MALTWSFDLIPIALCVELLDLFIISTALANHRCDSLFIYVMKSAPLILKINNCWFSLVD